MAQAEGRAEPWRDASFIDLIANLQKQRQIRASRQEEDFQFHDRSVVCTAALALYLGYRFSSSLAAELERVKKDKVYEKQVLFVRNLGFVAPTAARQISFEETLRFERIHEVTYQRFGFNLVFIEPGDLSQRVSAVKAAVRTPEASHFNTDQAR